MLRAGFTVLKNMCIENIYSSLPQWLEIKTLGDALPNISHAVNSTLDSLARPCLRSQREIHLRDVPKLIAYYDFGLEVKILSVLHLENIKEID